MHGAWPYLYPLSLGHNPGLYLLHLKELLHGPDLYFVNS
jgi:hypothetical protein